MGAARRRGRAVRGARGDARSSTTSIASPRRSATRCSRTRQSTPASARAVRARRARREEGRGRRRLQRLGRVSTSAIRRSIAAAASGPSPRRCRLAITATRSSSTTACGSPIPPRRASSTTTSASRTRRSSSRTRMKLVARTLVALLLAARRRHRAGSATRSAPRQADTRRRQRHHRFGARRQASDQAARRQGARGRRPKGSDGPKIIIAVHQLSLRMGSAKRALGVERDHRRDQSRPRALWMPASRFAISRASSAAAGKRAVTMPLAVLTDLIAREVPIPTATDLVLQLARCRREGRRFHALSAQRARGHRSRRRSDRRGHDAGARIWSCERGRRDQAVRVAS